MPTQNSLQMCSNPLCGCHTEWVDFCSDETCSGCNLRRRDWIHAFVCACSDPSLINNNSNRRELQWCERCATCLRHCHARMCSGTCLSETRMHISESACPMGGYYCERCHTRIHGERCLSCSQCRGIDYCRSCNNCYTCCMCGAFRRHQIGNNRVMAYGTDPTRLIKSEILAIRNYGIELEVEVIDESDLASDILEHPILKKKWVVKSDGSLSEDGIEIVSIPMPYEKIIESIQELFDLTNMKNRIERDECCGTHIHISRDSVSARTIGRLWAIFARAGNSEEMSKLLKCLCGRKSNGFNQWDSDPPVTIKTGHRIGRLNRNGHYSTVSCSNNYPTFEIRAFAGVTNPSTAIRYVQTLDLLLDICEETHGIQVITDWKTLLEYMGKRLNRYPTLYNTFHAKKANGVTPLYELGNYAEYICKEQFPRKLRVRNKRTGRDTEVEFLDMDPLKKVKKTHIKEAMKYLSKVEEKFVPKTKKVTDKNAKVKEFTKQYFDIADISLAPGFAIEFDLQGNIIR